MDKKRVLLDTNVYGRVIEESLSGLVKKLEKKEKIVVYGNAIIRKELRNIPRTRMVGTKKIRTAALSLFDLLVGKHSIEITNLTSYIALEYMKNYKEIMDNSLLNDFLIVASASLKELDIVCSEDEKTMKSKRAIEAYRKVNSENDLRTPKFIKLRELEAML